MKIRIKEKPWDLVLIMVLASLLLVVVLTAQIGPLRVVLGLALVFFLPGYVIVSALFPKAESINTVERIAFSFGVSIAVVSLIGLLLNYSPWGVRLYPLMTSLFVLILSVSILAWYRRNQIPVEDRFCIEILIELPKGEEVTIIDQILNILLVITVIIAICSLFFVITAPKEEVKFTEFYILNENRTAGNYPTNLTINENGAVIVGVICREHERTVYTVEIELVKLTGERENRTFGHYNLPLEHNQLNETVVNFNVSDNGTYKLQFLLYINDVREPYRDLHLWIDVKP